MQAYLTAYLLTIIIIRQLQWALNKLVLVLQSSRDEGKRSEQPLIVQDASQRALNIFVGVVALRYQWVNNGVNRIAPQYESP